MNKWAKIDYIFFKPQIQEEYKENKSHPKDHSKKGNNRKSMKKKKVLINYSRWIFKQ